MNISELLVLPIISVTVYSHHSTLLAQSDRLNPLRACWFNRPRATLEPPRHRPYPVFNVDFDGLGTLLSNDQYTKCDSSTSCQYAPAVTVDDPQNVA
ncbi:hypothetical protein EV363DRAFT_1341109 [Boletus edulis]|uniref:Uncharacterized protein n=1 Tax=Boletus edulis BED1 TaxID=1328754 RepID=A0AAD4BE74_BOLED|nr:hypothetical protein EV363DRAFT_1341109 [Boletus edulis]KAF8414499.1 hypothetical protein L210DRAFT_3592330 [Boletus edulis BED1]KAF8422139.1 hypothetical protein L210DRAFT_3571918 [Boletus edulis BED1]